MSQTFATGRWLDPTHPFHRPTRRHFSWAKIACSGVGWGAVRWGSKEGVQSDLLGRTITPPIARATRIFLRGTGTALATHAAPDHRPPPDSVSEFAMNHQWGNESMIAPSARTPPSSSPTSHLGDGFGASLSGPSINSTVGLPRGVRSPMTPRKRVQPPPREGNELQFTRHAVC